MVDDPYTLWKNGNWTISKFNYLFSKSNGIEFPRPKLNDWLTASGVSAVKRSGNGFAENLGSSDVLAALNSYAKLSSGSTGMADDLFGGHNVTLGSLNSYKAMVDYAKEFLKNHPSTEKRFMDFKIVPLPTGFTAGGKYPGYTASGYSAAKGCANPYVAVCFAKFEGGVKYSEINYKDEAPTEIRDYVEDAFAKNGYLAISGMASNESGGVSSILRAAGDQIASGKPVADVVNEYKPQITEIINDCMSKAK